MNLVGYHLQFIIAEVFSFDEADVLVYGKGAIFKLCKLDGFR
ncbi:hypothetical protein GGR08_000603 [Bartonella fuyuanensis]|uniref:Uncharacterized protein n=1 Tax=Bartonella fuyuanensis TaxID=1460968 RepID=A0A840DTL2_9HYPH|nr:hypothetical protein [Bartonella fuyuanensis]MBB4076310.1 hypothetical protein [Bartonella fuyuanensis]